MSGDEVVRISFGAGGNDANYLGNGWSGDEPGYRWTVGEASELWLENPGTEADQILELSAAPFVVETNLPAQQLRILVRGTVIGKTKLVGPGSIGFRVPACVFAGSGPVRVVFEHPDAARPADFGRGTDTRVLAISFHSLSLSPLPKRGTLLQLDPIADVAARDIGRLTGTPAVQFMQRFESLGDNCEFGLVQRRCGAEPLGLLRFANMELRQLLLSLSDGFEGIGEPAEMEFWLSDGARREYVIRDRRHALVYHTFLYEAETVEQELIEKQSRRLRFLRRKLLEELANGEKIFVCKRNPALTEQEILPLHAALNRFAQNTLLWVVEAEAGKPAGGVEQVVPGLLRGYIDRFAPYENAHDLSLSAWLSVCVNAFRLTRGDPAQ